MRESAFDKSRRYLVEGRLVVTEVTASTVKARVRGQGSIHRTGYDDGRWACSCPAVTVQCAHIRALKLIVAVDIPAGPYETFTRELNPPTERQHP